MSDDTGEEILFDKPQLKYWYIKNVREMIIKALMDARLNSDIINFDVDVRHSKILVEALDFYLKTHAADFDEIENKNLNEKFGAHFEYQGIYNA